MVIRRLVLIVFSIISFSVSTFASNDLKINIIAPQTLLDTSISSISILDFQSLLKQACNCEVTLNGKVTKVNIVLPYVDDSIASAPTVFSQNAVFPYKHFPAHQYRWQQVQDKKKRYHLMLDATSFQGVSFGLYGLLQEKLGFRFYHPRKTIIPHFDEWKLKEDFGWNATPLFDKKGFHLHTQHPLELTEQLLDESKANALNDIKEYINWLCRNGQNYFEFCLLRSIKKDTWIEHAKSFTEYAHQRGLLVSVDLSLHMIQQKAFQLYGSSVNKKKQIERNLNWLNKANWDFINMEFSTAEFIGGNKQKKEELRQYILQWLQENSKAKLMGRQHVVTLENEAGSKKDFQLDSANALLDKQRGVLAHTVMFYDMTEQNAPVYENKNQRHIFNFLLKENKTRETWYYPESAYWITFDNSVPMLLLPYLKARLTDIDTCVYYKIPGHITFSSGWEWGYWLNDWSIARWSWQHTTNGVKELRTPEMYAHQILDSAILSSFDKSLKLQQEYLKDSSLMQWMTAMTITDEIGIKSIAHEYHPRPKLSYKYIRNKASLKELEQIQTDVIPVLNRFAENTKKVVSEIRKVQPFITDSSKLNAEVAEGLEVTSLRAFHRLNTLKYLVAKRESKIKHEKFKADSLLQNAAKVRVQALKIVEDREKNYRYPVDLIARKRWDHTAYHFGYLYPVSNLHFWEREEKQAEKNQYRPLFMNIWNMGRIAGLVK